MNGRQDAQSQMGYELAIYREQISMLKRETERISMTTIDLANALRTVEGLKAEEVMMPIGGGALIKGRVSETQVLVPVGAGYLVEVSKENAALEINKRIEATKKAVEKLNEEYVRIIGKFQDVSMQLQQVQAQQRISDQAEENVRDDYV